MFSIQVDTTNPKAPPPTTNKPVSNTLKGLFLFNANCVPKKSDPEFKTLEIQINIVVLKGVKF